MSASDKSLDLILRDPRTCASLSRSQCAELLAAIAAVESAIAARLLASESLEHKSGMSEPVDDWLTVEQAAALVQRRPRWIWRNKKTLPFVRMSSPRKLLCSRRGIEQWLSRRRIG